VGALTVSWAHEEHLRTSPTRSGLSIEVSR
jgi:hypothetical protein